MTILKEGTYVIGDPKNLLKEGVEPDLALKVENGRYLDQYKSSYVIESGIMAIVSKKMVKHPHLFTNVINLNSGCCNKGVHGDNWVLGWTRQFTVLVSYTDFEVSQDNIIEIGPLRIKARENSVTR